MSDITQLSDEDLKAASVKSPHLESVKSDITQLSDEELKAASSSKAEPQKGLISDIGKGVQDFAKGAGRGISTMADFPRALPGMLFDMPMSDWPTGPTKTQQFNQTFGAPKPFQLNNPSTYPETLGGAIPALAAPVAGKLAEGATGLAGLAANYAIPGAVTNMGFQTAERTAQGQPTTPGNLALDAATGGVLNSALGPPLEKGLSWAGQAIMNKFAPKPPKTINLDQAAPQLPAEVPSGTPAAATEAPQKIQLGEETPALQGKTTRERAVNLRTRTGTLNERLSFVVDKKLQLDQFTHNLEQSYALLAERIKNRDKVNITRKKQVVIDPKDRRTAREAATLVAGLRKNQVRADDRPYLDLIRKAGTSLERWNPGNKIMSDKQLTAEVEKWLFLRQAAHKAYKEAKDISGLDKILAPGSDPLEVVYKGHTYIVKHMINKGQYKPRGTPEQNAAYYAEYQKLMALAEELQRKINDKFEPDITKLIDYLKFKDPQMAKAIAGVRALKTTEVAAAIEKHGLTEIYNNVLEGLISNDDNIRKVLSVGAVVAGQAMGNPAQAATDEKEQERNALNVGGALTTLGLIGLVGPKALNTAAAKEVRSQTAHFLFYVSDKYYVPALKAAVAALEKLNIKVTPEIANTVNRLMGAITLSRSNMDIIERNADPVFIQAFKVAKNEYRKATGGAALMPLNATVEQSQAVVKGMYAGSISEIEHLPLTDVQKKILRNMFFAKRRVADICRKEEERLTPHRNPSKAQEGGVYGNKGLAATIKMEREMNWQAGSPYQRGAFDNVMNLIAHGATQAAQLGGLPLHMMHTAEGKGSEAPRFFIENAIAEVLIDTRNKIALAFCRANNVTMPLVGAVQDTETAFTGKVAMWQEAALKKILGEANYNKGLNVPALQTVRRLGSGKGFESQKTDVALVTGSEVAARILDYPGGGENLRADFTHWMNGEEHKLSSHFSPEKGFATLGIIYDNVLDHCLGSDAIGIRVNLQVDRWAYSSGAGIIKSLTSFTRTAQTANRARNLLAQAALDGLANGDLQKAAAAGGAFFMTYAISSMWQGSSTIEKEYEQYLLDHHPLELVKLHKAMAQFNIVGQLPGAVGYALNRVGIKNEFEKNNFVLSHTQPTVFWPSRLSSPQPLEAGKSVVELGNPKTPQKTKNRDLIFLAGILGCGSIADTISLSHAFRMYTAFVDSRDKGGHVDFSYSPRWPLNADAQIPEGQESWGREKSHYLNQHLEEQPSGLAAAAVSFFRPGDSIAKEEHIFNDNVEYACQRLLKREFPEKTLDYFTEKLEASCPVNQYYEHIYRKISIHTATAQEQAMFADTRTQLLAKEHEENSPIIPLFDKMVKPKEYWQTAYKNCQDHPDAAKQLQPSPEWAKAHHRAYVQ